MTDLSGRSVIKRVGKGLASLSLNALVNIVGQLSIVPIALMVWGKSRYGEWVTISGLVLLLKLTDLGLQTYVVNRMCSAYARSEREELQNVLSNSLKVQIPFVIGLFSLLALVFWTLPLDAVLNLQTVGHTEVMTAILFLTAELLLGVPMGVIAGTYRATGRLPRAAVIGTAQQTSLLVVTLTLMATNASFALVAGARFLVALIFTFWILRDLKHLYPWINQSPWQGDWAEGVKMIVPGLFFLLVPLSDYLANQVTLIFLQKQMGGSEVSRLTTHRTAVNLAQMVSGLLTSAVWPELTSLYAAGRKEQLGQLYQGVVKLNLWLVGAITLGMLPFLPLIYSSWTAGRLMLDPWTLAFLVSRVIAWSFWNVGASLLYAINQQRLVAMAQFCAALMTNLLAYFLIPHYGMSGAAIATCLSDLAICAWLIPQLTARSIEMPSSIFWRAAVLPILASLILPFILGLVMWRGFTSISLRYFVILPVSAGACAFLTWLTLTTDERGLLSKISQRFQRSIFV